MCLVFISALSLNLFLETGKGLVHLDWVRGPETPPDTR
jgi:hypothetical protein